MVWLALLFTLALTAPAAAQSVHVIRAPLSVDGNRVGELWAGDVRIARWARDDAPVIRYADHDVELEAAVALGERETYVVAGVGRGTAVRTDAPFRIEMRARSWAPLAGRAPGGLRILLPEGFPAPDGVIGPSAAVPRGADRPADAFSHAGAPPSFDPGCAPIPLRARPADDAPLWSVDGSRASIHLGPARGGFTRARVFVDGFVVHGWIRGALPECEPTIGLSGIGTGCGDGHGGVAVTLPAGTALYATRTARHPFATLRRDVTGVEPMESVAAEACDSNGVCRRIPPEPRGTARWILHAHAAGDRGGWILEAWVRTPAERLARPADASSGFGGCMSHPSDWPSR